MLPSLKTRPGKPSPSPIRGGSCPSFFSTLQWVRVSDGEWESCFFFCISIKPGSLGFFFFFFYLAVASCNGIRPPHYKMFLSLICLRRDINMMHGYILGGCAACQTTSMSKHTASAGRIGAAVTVHKYADWSVDSFTGC